MKILIVDDEHLARERLRDLISEIDPGHSLLEASHGLDALEIHDREQADLVLLDIRMPVMDGLETARHLAKLEEPPAVVFTTAYQDHALEAFEAQALDYLLKPIRSDRLQQAIEKSSVLQSARIQAIQESEDNTQRQYISVKSKGGLKIVPVKDIDFFRAEQKYVSAFWSEGELLLDDTLKELEEEFSQLFLRIHRNSLVAKNTITGLEKDTEGNFAISLRNNPEKLPVSRRHVSQVRAFLKQRQ